ncbi:MAG: NrdH-redoxin [Candidatus Thorarchaeota archaeon]|nr:NrdH-redoxin [Candidatus Thorarchaeota archaeon]
MKATVYIAPQCPHAAKLIEFLAANGVEMEKKSILDGDNVVRELFEVSKQRAVPVAVIDGEVFVGFDRRVERRLKRKLEGTGSV